MTASAVLLGSYSEKIESVAAGSAAFDLAVACYLSNISRWHLSGLPRQADDVR
jgi:hypothetical protein